MAGGKTGDIEEAGKTVPTPTPTTTPTPKPAPTPTVTPKKVDKTVTMLTTPITLQTLIHLGCFDFDQTISNQHLYHKYMSWLRKTMQTHSPQTVKAFFDGIKEILGVSHIGELLVQLEDDVDPKDGPAMKDAFIRWIMKVTNQNVTMVIVTYGLKDLVYEFFRRLGLTIYFPKRNILGWREGFKMYGAGDVSDASPVQFAELSKMGKNPYVNRLVDELEYWIDDIWMVDDMENNANRLVDGTLKKQYPEIEFHGVTSDHPSHKKTGYYLTEFLTRVTEENLRRGCSVGDAD